MTPLAWFNVKHWQSRKMQISKKISKLVGSKHTNIKHKKSRGLDFKLEQHQWVDRNEICAKKLGSLNANWPTDDLLRNSSGVKIQSLWNHLFSNYDFQEDIEIHSRVWQIFGYSNIFWYKYLFLSYLYQHFLDISHKMETVLPFIINL